MSPKEWARMIYLMKKSLKKEPNEKDLMLLYKIQIFAEQAKIDFALNNAEDIDLG